MCAGFAGGTVFIVWVRVGRESQFCSSLAKGGDDISSSPSFKKTTKLWIPWGAPFGALLEQGVVKALMHHHGWGKGRALVWVQFFCDDIRMESHTATSAIFSKRMWEQMPCNWSKQPQGHW